MRAAVLLRQQADQAAEIQARIRTYRHHTCTNGRRPVTEDTLQQVADAMTKQAEKPATDSMLTSAWRGRILAALSAGMGLWVTARSAWQSVAPMLDAGMSMDDVLAVVGHVNVVLTAADAAMVAGAAVISAGAAVWSKWRERW
jgi:hypothetical protein